MRKTYALISVAVLALTGLISTSCTTPASVADQYRAETRDQRPPKIPTAESETTVLIFLVDGFAISTLTHALTAKSADEQAPNLARFFHVSSHNLHLGRAAFPTLTYPNLVSILTGSAVNHHGINGNRVLDDQGVEKDFEEVQNWSYLNKRIGKQTMFARLRDNNETSVSYSFPFTYGTTARAHKTIEAGVDYAEKDYERVDQETLLSLANLFTTTPLEKWPRFLFVHLIGVDSYSHEFGPNDERTRAYVHKLDAYLEPVFDAIRLAEKAGHQVKTVMTADHGFVTTTHAVHVKALVETTHLGVRVVEDNRVASFYIPQRWKLEKREAFAESMLSIQHTAWSALRDGNSIELFGTNGLRGRIELGQKSCLTGNRSARVEWIQPHVSAIRYVKESGDFYCPEEYDQKGITSEDGASFMVSGLVEYFTAPDAPDMVLLPDAHSDFSGEYAGNHGGLTTQEVYVPILSRHADLPATIIPTSQLVHFLNVL
jgi:hypothetical protein